jgi:hypothetical protein
LDISAEFIHFYSVPGTTNSEKWKYPKGKAVAIFEKEFPELLQLIDYFLEAQISNIEFTEQALEMFSGISEKHETWLRCTCLQFLCSW